EPTKRTIQKRKAVINHWQLQRQAIVEIGKIIRLKRKGLGITQAELADYANFSQCKLSALESGKIHKEIKLFLLLDIAKIVGAEEEVIWFITKLLEIERPSTNASRKAGKFFGEEK
ncbi:MAG TPA: helix-turn-helix domain-containing protein, partial [Phormidium sp.]